MPTGPVGVSFSATNKHATQTVTEVVYQPNPGASDRPTHSLAHPLPMPTLRPPRTTRRTSCQCRPMRCAPLASQQVPTDGTSDMLTGHARTAAPGHSCRRCAACPPAHTLTHLLTHPLTCSLINYAKRDRRYSERERERERPTDTFFCLTAARSPIKFSSPTPLLWPLLAG